MRVQSLLAVVALFVAFNASTFAVQYPRHNGLLSKLASTIVITASNRGNTLEYTGEGRNSPDWKFVELSRRSRAPWSSDSSRSLRAVPYDPAPLDDQESAGAYVSEEEVAAKQRALDSTYRAFPPRTQTQRRKQRSRGSSIRGEEREGEQTEEGEDEGEGEGEKKGDRSSGGPSARGRRQRSAIFGTRSLLPKVKFRCDPLVNFKLKQRLVVLGACVTLGLDYLSDIAQWRSYCAVEDSVVGGRFSLRGQELGWAKAWTLNLGLGEEQNAKLKLRLGLNLRNQRAYAKLRFRTEPISPFDIGDGLTCAGKLPLPVQLLPALKSVPLRVEYRLRLGTSRLEDHPAEDLGHHPGLRPRPDLSSSSAVREKRAFLTTGIGTLDVSLDELNFCLEWDEKSPVWGVGLVRSGPNRRSLPLPMPLASAMPLAATTATGTTTSASTPGGQGPGVRSGTGTGLGTGLGRGLGLGAVLSSSS